MTDERTIQALQDLAQECEAQAAHANKQQVEQCASAVHSGAGRR
jgi:hypothetical protein